MNWCSDNAAIPQFWLQPGGELVYSILKGGKLQLCLAMMSNRIGECPDETQRGVKKLQLNTASCRDFIQRSDQCQLFFGRCAIEAITNFKKSLDTLPIGLLGVHVES